MDLPCGQEEWGVLDLCQISPFTAAGEGGGVQIKPHKTFQALEQCKAMMTCGEMMTMIDSLKLVKKSKTENEKKVSQKDSSHSAFGKSTSDDDDICAAERFITLSLRKTMLALFLFRPLSVSMMVMMMNDHIFDEVFSFFKTCLILSFFSGMYLDHQHPPLPQIALLLNLFDRMLYDQISNV